MENIIALVGFLAIVEGALYLTMPGMLKIAMSLFCSPKLSYVFGILIAAIGLLFIGGDKYCSFPILITTWGVLFLALGLIVCLIRTCDLQKLCNMVISLQEAVIRFLGITEILIGISIIAGAIA
jgi:hypothetical protein